ncbi:MAG: class I SAM-dependent methyltransferase [Bacteroidetes bacterium]|nr:class I SAM-dependent methyltransferase [Bacteroidota bacterium]
MKKTNQILIVTGGIILILLGLFHMCFWSLFDWKYELEKLTLVNRNVVQMLNIGSCVMLVSMGGLLLLFRKEILETKLGRAVLILPSIFLFTRFVMGFIFRGGSPFMALILLLSVFVFLIPALRRKTVISDETNSRTCPVEYAGGLDNSFRRLLQNPRKILKPYIHTGMTVLDLGCGPGFFSIEIANMLAGSGKVIAADLQDGMLEKLIAKIKGTELEQRIETHKCEPNKAGITENVDFILLFYMIHEVSDQGRLLEELKSILKPNGKIYIIEPKFHVSKKSFEILIDRIRNLGFDVIDSPKVFFSRTVLLTINK